MADISMSKLASRNVAQWVAEEKARKERKTAASRSTPPDRRVITISRQYGAGAHLFAELVEKRLGPTWQIWDKEIVDEVAKSANVRDMLVSALDERSLSREEEIIRYLTNIWGMCPEDYYRHLVRVLLALSQQGDKIIIGRGAGFVLSNALRVRLCASEEFRVKSIMKSEGGEEGQVRARIAQVGKERARFASKFFHRDVHDPHHYDLVLNLDSIGLEAGAAAAAPAMQAICDAAE